MPNSSSAVKRLTLASTASVHAAAPESRSDVRLVVSCGMAAASAVLSLATSVPWRLSTNRLCRLVSAPRPSSCMLHWSIATDVSDVSAGVLNS